jgi:hypothetical protein
MGRCKEAYAAMFEHLPGGKNCKDSEKKREALKVQLEWNEKLNRELNIHDDELPKDLKRLVKYLTDIVSAFIYKYVRHLQLIVM